MYVIDYDCLSKYNINYEGCDTYVKYICVGNTDSDNPVKHRKKLRELYTYGDLNIEDGDTLVISDFGRSNRNPEIYGFFVENLNKNKDIEMAIPIDPNEYQDGGYDMLRFAGRYIAKALKNEGYSDVKVISSLIMDYRECQRFIYYCELLGDEFTAANYIFEKDLRKVMIQPHKLERDDILLRFAPENLKTILENLDGISETLNIGTHNNLTTYIKGLFYLDKTIESKLYTGEEIFLDNRHSTVSPKDGLYLCLYSSLFETEDYFISDFPECLSSCNKKYGVEFISSMAIPKDLEFRQPLDGKYGSFIKTEEELKDVLAEIEVDAKKYKANHEFKNDLFRTNIFRAKNLNQVIFSDIMIRSSAEGMIEIYERIDEIRTLLKDTNLFIKGFAYTKDREYTTGDYEINLEEDFPNIYEYDIVENAVYLILGDKDTYYTSYNVLDKIDDLLEQRIAFTLVTNVNVGSTVFQRNDLVQYLSDEEIDNVIKDFKNLTNLEKYKNNYLFSWIEHEAVGIYSNFKIAAKYLEGNNYLVADFRGSSEPGIACKILFRTLDITKVSKEEYEFLKEFSDDEMDEELNYESEYTNYKKVNDLLKAHMLAAVWYHCNGVEEFIEEEKSDLECLLKNLSDEEIVELPTIEEYDETLASIRKAKSIIEKSFTSEIISVELNDEQYNKAIQIDILDAYNEYYVFNYAESLLKSLPEYNL